MEIAKTLQRLKGINDDDEKKEEESVDRRKTAYNLAVSRGNKNNNVNDLNVAFRRRLAKFVGDPSENFCVLSNCYDYIFDLFLLDYRGPVRRETVAAINRRRDTVVRRKSLAPGLQSMSPNSGPPILNAHDNPAFFDDTFDSTFDSVI